MEANALGEYSRDHEEIFVAALGNYRGDYTIGTGMGPNGEGRILLQVPDGSIIRSFPKQSRPTVKRFPSLLKGAIGNPCLSRGNRGLPNSHRDISVALFLQQKNTHWGGYRESNPDSWYHKPLSYH